MFKACLSFFCVFCIVGVVGCKAEGILENKQNQHSVVTNLKIIRADIVSDSIPGLVPWIARAKNGDWIVCSFDKNDMITGAGTNFVRSSDQGKTWSKPFLSMKSTLANGQLLGMIQSLPDGNIIAFLTEVDLSNKNQRYYDFYYALSRDNGITFSERQRLNDPNMRKDFAQGLFVELPNGDLLCPWGQWGNDFIAGFRRSLDGGKIWQPTVRAWQDPPPGEQDSLVFNETAAVVCKDKSLLAIARTDKKLDKKFWQIKSYDNGETWTLPKQINLSGGSPALYCLENGVLLFAFRDAGIGPGVGLAVSKDNGEKWEFLFHLKDPTGEFEKLYAELKWSDNDLKKTWRPGEGMAGYPCFLPISKSKIYVVFHLYNRKLSERFGQGADLFYIAGNLIEIEEK